MIITIVSRYKMLIIRQENMNDYEYVYNVIEKAFEKAEHSDGNEQDLVVLLRKSNSFIPELSLVAVEDDYFMVIKLNENDKKISGVIGYDEAFGI